MWHAIELEPKNDRAHYILDCIYLDQGYKDKARAEIEEFLSLYLDHAYAREWNARAEEYLQQLKPSNGRLHTLSCRSMQ